MRLGAIFIAACMVLIAASVGAVAYLSLGFNGTAALAAAAAVLCGLGFYNTVSARSGVQATVDPQLRDLARGNADLARQVAEIGRSLAALEFRMQERLDRSRAATDPLATEIGELGSLVRQLAETVAIHELKLIELAVPKQHQRPADPEPTTAAQAAAIPIAEIAASIAQAAADAPGGAAQATSLPQANASSATATSPAVITDPVAAPHPKVAETVAMLATIRSAIDASRVDLYLQPIVTLPQRKVRYYEALTRLRTDKGEVLAAGDFITQAETGGLMPRIDNLIVFRCVQVVRRLLLKNRDVGLFCNLSGSTLADGIVFPQLLEFMDANRAIAPSLVFDIPQAALRNAGPMENESLAALADRGFRFSLDNVTDLRFEPRELASRGFRFVKISAGLLLNRAGATASDIHPADLSDLLNRFGIELVAEKIESEGSVVDLLDYDVKFGQGFLFSPPRPVRAEALQGVADRGDIVAPAPASEEAAPRGTDGPADATTGGKRVSAFAQIARRI